MSCQYSLRNPKDVWQHPSPAPEVQKLYLSHPGFEPKTCPFRERAANQISQSELQGDTVCVCVCVCCKCLVVTVCTFSVRRPTFLMFVVEASWNSTCLRMTHCLYAARMPVHKYMQVNSDKYHADIQNMFYSQYCPCRVYGKCYVEHP